MQTTIMNESKIRQAWCLRTATPGTGREGWEDCCELQGGRSCRAKSNLVSESQREEQKKGQTVNTVDSKHQEKGRRIFVHLNWLVSVCASVVIYL